MKNITKLRIGVLPVLFLHLSASVFAQLTGTPTNAQKPNDEVVELSPFIVNSEPKDGSYRSKEIIGANKIATSLEDFAGMANVLNAAMFQDIKPRYTADIAKFVSSVTQDQYAFEDRLTMRGIVGGSLSLQDGFQNVARYQEPLVNVDQLEIIKGPQGVLYGQVGFGGIINRTMKRPRFDFGGSTEVSVGNRDFYEGSFDVYGPLGKTLAYRVVALKRGGGEPIKTVRKIGSFESIYASILKVFSPSHSLEARISWNNQLVSGQNGNLEIPDYGLATVVAPGVVFAPIAKYDSRITSNNPTKYDNTNKELAILYRRKFGRWSARFGAMWTDSRNPDEIVSAGNFSGGFLINPVRDANNFLVDGYLRRFYLNRTFNSHNDSYQADVTGDFLVGKNTITVTGGAGYSDNSAEEVKRRLSFATFGSATPAPLFLNFANPDFRDPLQQDPLITNLAGSRRHDNKAYVYANSLVKLLNDRLQVSLGAREDSYDVATNSADLNVAPNNTINKGKDTSYRAGVVGKLSKSLSLFAAYGDTFAASTGFTGTPPTASPNITATNLEAGLKLSFLSGRAFLQGSAFHIRANGLSRWVDVNTGSVKDADRDVKGMELDFQAELVPGLQVLAGWSKINAKQLGDTTANANLINGTRPVNVPEDIWNVLLNYRFSRGPLAGLSVGVASTHTGDKLDAVVTIPGSQAPQLTPADRTNVRLYTPAVTFYDLRAGYQINKAWSLNLYCRNAGNKIAATKQDLGNGIWLAPRKTIQFTVRYDY